MLSVVTLGAFGVSTHWAIIGTGQDLSQVYLNSGQVGVSWRPPEWKDEPMKYPPRPGWTVATYPNTFEVTLRPDVNLHDRSRLWRWIGVPLWILFLLVALPTTYLLWTARRRFPGGCCHRCGYDLTGNTSGACPECGTKAPAEA